MIFCDTFCQFSKYVETVEVSYDDLQRNTGFLNMQLVFRFWGIIQAHMRG